jgi:hypothetical protein
MFRQLNFSVCFSATCRSAHSPSKRLFCGDQSPRTDLSRIIATTRDDVVKNSAAPTGRAFPLVRTVRRIHAFRCGPRSTHQDRGRKFAVASTTLRIVGLTFTDRKRNLLPPPRCFEHARYAVRHHGRVDLR